MNVEIWGWDTANTEWVKALVDSSGHLQVDVLSGVGVASQLYGYDSTNWQTLLVESAALKNLRVKLYDGATGISSAAMGYHTLTGSGLNVHAQVWGRTGAAAAAAINADYPNDDTHASTERGLDVISLLHGFDGTYFERLRTYATGILKVGRAEVGLSNSGVLSGDTEVKSSAGKVYWMSVSDTAALSIELNDSTDNSGTDRFAAVLPANCYGHYIFDPPIEFTSGIYLDVSTATCKIVVGYL